MNRRSQEMDSPSSLFDFLVGLMAIDDDMDQMNLPNWPDGDRSLPAHDAQSARSMRRRALKHSDLVGKLTFMHTDALNLHSLFSVLLKPLTPLIQ